MKTLNKNIRKKSKVISFFIILLVATSNVLAQKSFNTISLNAIEKNMYHDSKTDILEAFSLSYDSSEEILLEEWMMNPTEWIEQSATVSVSGSEDYLDDLSDIENWMVEPEWFTVIAEEVEIEDWMTDPESWNISLAEEVELENWMTEPERWNKSLAEEVELENWMADPFSWNIFFADEAEFEEWMTAPCTWYIQNELVQENTEDYTSIR